MCDTHFELCCVALLPHINIYRIFNTLMCMQEMSSFGLLPPSQQHSSADVSSQRQFLSRAQEALQQVKQLWEGRMGQAGIDLHELQGGEASGAGPDWTELARGHRFAREGGLDYRQHLAGMYTDLAAGNYEVRDAGLLRT